MRTQSGKQHASNSGKLPEITIKLNQVARVPFTSVGLIFTFWKTKDHVPE